MYLNEILEFFHVDDFYSYVIKRMLSMVDQLHIQTMLERIKVLPMLYVNHSNIINLIPFANSDFYQLFDRQQALM